MTKREFQNREAFYREGIFLAYFTALNNFQKDVLSGEEQQNQIRDCIVFKTSQTRNSE